MIRFPVVPAAQLPVIHAFTVSPETIAPDSRAILSWTTDGTSREVLLRDNQPIRDNGR